MDAVKFLQERSRMYKSGAATPSIGLEDDYDPVSAVEIVEEWSAAHPRKTRQSVFLEQWPNAKVFAGVLDFCPQDLDSRYPCQSTDVEMRCQSCRHEFWMQEVE